MHDLELEYYLTAIELKINTRVTLLVKELNKSNAPWIAQHIDELDEKWQLIRQMCHDRTTVRDRIKHGRATDEQTR
jgi:hemerythrin